MLAASRGPRSRSAARPVRSSGSGGEGAARPDRAWDPGAGGRPRAAPAGRSTCRRCAGRERRRRRRACGNRDREGVVDLPQFEVFQRDQPAGDRQRGRGRSPAGLGAGPGFGAVGARVGGDVLHRPAPGRVPAPCSICAPPPELPEPVGARLPDDEMLVGSGRGLGVRPAAAPRSRPLCSAGESASLVSVTLPSAGRRDRVDRHRPTGRVDVGRALLGCLRGQIPSLKAPTSAAELGSSGASAASGSFQKLVGRRSEMRSKLLQDLGVPRAVGFQRLARPSAGNPRGL